MSINHRRMSSLIDQEVNKLPDLSASQCDRLKKLAEKIYLWESTEETSGKLLIDGIASEISLAADKWKEEGNE